MRESQYYRQEATESGDKIRCELCPRACLLSNGEIGHCRGRQAIDNKLFSINYQNAVSLAVDPIEKKPLYHFNPGTQIISLGPNSCNLDCSFCQNWEISQEECPTKQISIPELAILVRSMQPMQVAFTYSEPLMWYEYIADFAAYAPDVQIVLVTNAYLNQDPWLHMLKLVKAVNIDLKAFRDEFYYQQCGVHIEPVKRNIKLAYLAGVHIEITNLLIPGLNDSAAEIDELSAFIASIDAQIPLHISAYHPSHRLRIRATKTNEVSAVCEIAAKHLKHVYAGNVYLPQYARKSGV